MTLNTIKITENFPELAKVEQLALEAFPPEEYLAPKKLIEMSQDDGFDFYALYDKDMFVGFMVVTTYKCLSYLFFLAIDSTLRSKGYGSRAIETLKVLYPEHIQIVDFEMPDETAPNNAQRMSRRKFYLKNGYMETGKFLAYLGVEYEVFSTSAFDFNIFKEMMSEMRIEGFSPIYFDKNRGKI